MGDRLNLCLSLARGEPQGRRREQARHDFRIFQALETRVERHLGGLEGKRVLDVGCGRTYPFTLLLHSVGANVTGIDIGIIPRGPGSWNQMLAESGVRKTVGQLPTRLLLDLPYHRELRRTAGFPLLTRGLDLQRMDAASLAFDEGTFDLAVSNAAFEHFPNVPQVLSELRRVLKPRGIAHIEIHLFPSLTGGHNVEDGIAGTGVVEMGRTPPWDHLRQNLYPAPVYLNKLREHEYRQIFEQHFDILEWQTEFEEPASMLTPELEDELARAGYSREELLKRSVVVVASPR